MINEFELIRQLTNTKGMAILEVDRKRYAVRVDNATRDRATKDRADVLKFEGEVLAERTNENYHDAYRQAALYGNFPCVPSSVLAELNKRPYTPATVSSKFSLDIRNNIDKVIFNNPATIILWKDGTKTVVKCQKGETFDEEKGLAIAIAKRVLGDKGNFNEVFKKYVEHYVEDEKKEEPANDNRGKEGKWIIEEIDGCLITKRLTCSICGNSRTTIDPNIYIIERRYCPNCGAKIIGKEEKK